MKKKIKKLLHDWLIPIIILAIYVIGMVTGYFVLPNDVPFYYFFIPFSIPFIVFLLLFDIE